MNMWKPIYIIIIIIIIVIIIIVIHIINIIIIIIIVTIIIIICLFIYVFRILRPIIRQELDRVKANTVLCAAPRRSTDRHRH